MSAIMTMPMPVFPSSGAALIASPNSELRQEVLHRLNGRCRPVQQALGGADALAKLEKGGWQVLFLDRRTHSNKGRPHPPSPFSSLRSIWRAGRPARNSLFSRLRKACCMPSG
jgi:hypothetical protein